MDQQTAQVALQFLQRVQLTGAEVDAFLQVRNALAQDMQPPQAKADPEAMAKQKASADELAALRDKAKAPK